MEVAGDSSGLIEESQGWVPTSGGFGVKSGQEAGLQLTGSYQRGRFSAVRLQTASPTACTLGNGDDICMDEAELPSDKRVGELTLRSTGSR